MLSPVRTDSSYSAFLGVMDYKERAAHWHMVGQAHCPIASLEEIDLGGIDGVIGFFRDRRSVDVVTRAGVAAVKCSNALGDLPLPRVGHDDLAIGRLGAQHLFSRGFSRFVDQVIESNVYTEGVRAYLAAAEVEILRSKVPALGAWPQS